MNDSLAATIAAIKKSKLVYMAGDVDATTLFELGIAISLGRTVYYVAEQAENKVAALLPYDVEQLKYVSFQRFMDIVEVYM
jgi:nucleoside 2-deoxyribosyltransferase